ncbi:unnamed protein product, partial [Rotaria sp. Silwood1]
MAFSAHFTQYDRQQEIPVENLENLPIYYRVCCKFFPKDYDEETCVCNRKKYKNHIKEGKERKWDITTHTKQIRNTVYYGRLENNALFVRLDIETKLDTIENLLFKFWKIPKPTLIMSIIGGTKNFSLTDRLELKFLNSIINICIKSKVWMITNGFDTGIVQLVGRAIKKAQLKQSDKVIAIGICKWGSIKDVKALTKQYLFYPYLATAVTIVVEGGFDTIQNIYYDLRNHIPVVIINGSGRVADFFSRWLLSMKHLKKDRYRGTVVYEIDELSVTKVTQFSSENKKQQKSRTSIGIDAKIDVNASKTTLHELFEEFNEELEIDLKDILDGDNDLQNRKSLNLKIDKNKNEKRLADALNQVRYCLQPAVRSLITVFNLNLGIDLSGKIFESIGNSLEISRDNGEKQNKPASFLELAMDWDCIHVAKEFVLKNSLTNIPNQEEAFIKALDKNLPTFIYEFLRLGMDPAEIFFPPIKISSKQSRYKKFFENLYHDGAVNRDQTHIKYFINSDKETKTKKIDTLKSLNSV